MPEAQPADPACAAAFEAWWSGEPDVEMNCAMAARAAFTAGWEAAQARMAQRIIMDNEARYREWLASLV